MATVLAVADPQPGRALLEDPLVHALFAQSEWLRSLGWELRIVDYETALTLSAHGRVPVRVLLYFPHRAWNELIESRIPGPYGNRFYGRCLMQYMTDVERRLVGQLPGGRFLNHPSAVALTRDKVIVKRRWLATGVSTPPAVRARTPAEMLGALALHGRLFIKAPSASMGKGITVLSPNRWISNYTFDGERLRTPLSGEPAFVRPDRWRFVDLPIGDPALLEALCRTPRFLVEQAVTGRDGAPPVELRVTVLDGEVLAVTTADSLPALALAPADAAVRMTPPPSTALAPAVLTRVHEVSVRAATSLGLRYAVLDVLLDGQGRPFAVDVQAFPATGTDTVMTRRLIRGLLDEADPGGEDGTHLPALSAAGGSGGSGGSRRPAKESDRS